MKVPWHCRLTGPRVLGTNYRIIVELVCKFLFNNNIFSLQFRNVSMRYVPFHEVIQHNRYIKKRSMHHVSFHEMLLGICYAVP
jgi:hypothetical protein